MTGSIEENSWKILTAMATQQPDDAGQITLTGQKIQKITNLNPGEINDAISILEDKKCVKLLKLLGTHPFLFGAVTITPRGKNEYQQRTKNIQKDEIQFPSNFTPAMKEMMVTSLGVFDNMKSILLSSLTEAGKKHHLSNGLYYIVLIDLSGSTVAAGKMSGIEYPKWIEGFENITKAALNFLPNNITVHIKTIGDGCLFLFGNFDDILSWRTRVQTLCLEYNQKCKSDLKPDFYLYYNKIIVHIGEVYFDESGKDTNSFAVNVVFKIEKEFLKNDLGITEAVKQVIVPEINSGRFGIEKGNDYTLEEAKISIPLWKLSIPST